MPSDTPTLSEALAWAIRDAKEHEELWKKHPVSEVIWVPIDQVQANDYNPNTVAKTEMQLLATSIRHDGYTQPIVTVFDEERDVYVIVDGFHRYFCCKTFKDIYDSTGGFVPIVVIEKGINDRMASTIRHNRARGKHSVDGMANMVFAMLENGWSDAEICNHLGMSPEEVERLKHVTGFSKLFEDASYRRAWETDRQIRIRQSFKESQRDSELAGSDRGASGNVDGSGAASHRATPDQG